MKTTKREPINALASVVAEATNHRMAVKVLRSALNRIRRHSKVCTLPSPWCTTTQQIIEKALRATTAKKLSGQ